MYSILDAFPYPWSDRNAQQLHLTLSQLYPSAASALIVAQKSNIDTTLINGQQAPFFVWKDILELASTSGLAHTMIRVIHDQLPTQSPAYPFISDILNNHPTRTEHEPRNIDGAPKFISSTDEVSDAEALLYYDDLTIQIGRLPQLITTLSLFVTLAPAVCKLIVDIHGMGQYGTGFRIGPDMLLTNWHVLHVDDNDTRATAVTAEFGYEDDGKGGLLQSKVISCDIASIVASKLDDWAIIRVQQPLLDTWPIISLSESVSPQRKEAAYIIQHPGGSSKRIGFVRNQVSGYTEQVVHYLTDTMQGSSGAPVFNEQGRLIAVHHAGGRPQDKEGRAPLKKNEGIRISRIVAGLVEQGIVIP